MRQKMSQDYKWDEVIELIRIEEKMNSGLSLSPVEVEHLKRMGEGDSPRANLVYGRYLLSLGNDDDAFFHFKKAEEKGNHMILFDLGIIYLTKDKSFKDKGMTLIERAVTQLKEEMEVNSEIECFDA